jgi:hypothetical protein
MLRQTWEDNIRMDLKEMGVIRIIWIDSAQDRHLYESGNDPPGSISHVIS